MAHQSWWARSDVKCKEQRTAAQARRCGNAQAPQDLPCPQPGPIARACTPLSFSLRTLSFWLPQAVFPLKLFTLDECLMLQFH
jgi:hypothetical protein